MSFTLRESVGRRGANHYRDVIIVQSLLNRFTMPWNVHLRVDGVCGTRTVGAIMRFQRQCGLHIDGRVDPMGPTWAHLADIELLSLVHLNFSDIMAELEEIADVVLNAGGVAQNQATLPAHFHSTVHFSNWDKKTDVGPASSYPPISIAIGCVIPKPGMLCWGHAVSNDFKTKVYQIACDLDTNPDYLMACMAFETKQTFSPSIVNKAQKNREYGSSAVGLIQFLKTTAIGLGTTREALLRMTAVEQLSYVEKYLKPYRGHLQSLNDMYFCIITGNTSYCGKPASTIVFATGSENYTENAGLDSARKGYISVSDITDKVHNAYLTGLRKENIG